MNIEMLHEELEHSIDGREELEEMGRKEVSPDIFTSVLKRKGNKRKQEVSRLRKRGKENIKIIIIYEEN